MVAHRARSLRGLALTAIVGLLLTVATPALAADPGGRRRTRPGAPSAACAKVVKDARRVLAADDAAFMAEGPRATARTGAALDRALDRLRLSIGACDPPDAGLACAGVVAVAQNVVAADDELHRADTDAAEQAAFDRRDPAIAELAVRLADCKAGGEPEACAAAVGAARAVVRFQDRYEAATTDQAENAAQLAQDRAIQELALRIGTCRASGRVVECPEVLTAGAAVVDAEDNFHNGSTDAETDAALEAEATAIEQLRPAVRACAT